MNGGKSRERRQYPNMIRYNLCSGVIGAIHAIYPASCVHARSRISLNKQYNGVKGKTNKKIIK